MNSLTRNVLSFLLGACIIGLIGFFSFKGILILLDKIEKLDPNIVIAVIGGTVTILGYFITRYLERKKTIEQQIREQKLPTYEEFIDFIFNIFQQTKNQTEVDLKSLEKFYWSMNKKSILWLSDRTFKSYVTWKNKTAEYADKKDKSIVDSFQIMNSLGDLLKDFRADIGHKNKDISSTDILSLFITDINKTKENK